MRSSLSAASMGIGGILLCFGFVVFVLEIFARQGDVGHQVAEMSKLGVESLVLGAILFGLGFLLSKAGRRSAA